MARTQVVISPNPSALAEAVAGQLIDTLAQAQAAAQREQSPVSVVLTGGGIGIAVLEQVAQHPQRHQVRWAQLQVWWGDERYLPEGDTQRNDTQARQALLERVPVAAHNVHPMPAAAAGAHVSEQAAAYDHELDQALTGGEQPFTLVLLGVGPDGHVASLFPQHPTLGDGRWARAVLDSPKPPPTRITLTEQALNHADHVWLLACGAAKVDAVAQALYQDPHYRPHAGAARAATHSKLPASQVHGRERTCWWLDEAAAAGLGH